MNSNYNTVQLIKFLELLSFYYPYQVNVIHFRNLLSDSWSNLQQEIFLNLASLDKQSQLFYLHMIQKEIERKMMRINIDEEQWSEWAFEYSVISSRIFIDKEITEKLLVQIEEEHPSQYDLTEYYYPAKKIQPKTDTLAHRFYNFTYAFFSGEALEFIGNTIARLQPHESLKKKAMVKTTLTVAELGFFIKALQEKGVISIPSGKFRALCRAIAESTETRGKKAEPLSLDSLSNKFYSKDMGDAAESVQGKFYDLYLYAKEIARNSGR